MSSWEDFERHVAREVGGKRYLRDLYESAADIYLPDVDVVIDCKVRRRFHHHKLMAAIQTKYCRPHERPALVTRRSGRRGALVTVEMDFFVELLDAYRAQMNNAPTTESEEAMGANPL